MRIVLTTDDVYKAARVKDKILKAIKGELFQYNIASWSYTKAADNYDIIFCNNSMFTESQVNNVLFRVDLNGENVIFTTAYWSVKSQPSHQMYCHHVGMLTEILLTYFQGDFTKFSITER